MDRNYLDHMRPSFAPWTLAFLITRAGDLWTTEIWMNAPVGEAGETNPLSSILGFTFWPLVASNIIVTGALLFGHWWYCRHFTVRSIDGSPKDRSQFMSLVFYGRPDHARYLPIRSGSAPILYHAQLAYVLLQTIAVLSVLAVLHNLGQFHGWGISDTLRDVLVRPAFVIYSIGGVLLAAFYVRMAGMEFRAWQWSRFSRN